MAANADWHCSGQCRVYRIEPKDYKPRETYDDPTLHYIKRVTFDLTMGYDDVKTPTVLGEFEMTLESFGETKEGAIRMLSDYCRDQGSDMIDIWQTPGNGVCRPSIVGNPSCQERQ